MPAHRARRLRRRTGLPRANRIEQGRFVLPGFEMDGNSVRRSAHRSGDHLGLRAAAGERWRAAGGCVLGVHIAAPHASDLIGEGVLAIEMGATVEDLALTVHAHPTFGEMFGEAAHLALGRPLHVAAPGRNRSGPGSRTDR